MSLNIKWSHISTESVKGDDSHDMPPLPHNIKIMTIEIDYNGNVFVYD